MTTLPKQSLGRTEWREYVKDNYSICVLSLKIIIIISEAFGIMNKTLDRHGDPLVTRYQGSEKVVKKQHSRQLCFFLRHEIDGYVTLQYRIPRWSLSMGLE